MRSQMTLAMCGVLTAALGATWISPASAAKVFNEKIPVTDTWFVPCANDGMGEYISISGNIHVLITFTINGNNVSGKSQGQPQGLVGVGEITGDKYQGTGVTQEHFKGSLVNGQYQTTFVNNFRLIGQGPGNNFLEHATIHMTINANGEVTADLVNTSIKCK